MGDGLGFRESWRMKWKTRTIKQRPGLHMQVFCGGAVCRGLHGGFQKNRGTCLKVPIIMNSRSQPSTPTNIGRVRDSKCPST